MKAAVTLLGLLLALTTEEQAPPKMARIEGVVLNDASNEAIPAARLMLQQDGTPRPVTYAGTSGADGHFVMKNIPAGRYRLIASKQGFINRGFGERWREVPGIVLDLTSLGLVQDITLRLTPSAVIAGRVSDENGTPLERVAVLLFRRTYLSDGNALLLPEGRFCRGCDIAETNDLGEYRMFEVPSGTYFVVAIKDREFDIPTAVTPFIELSEEPPLLYPPTFYPNAIDEAGAVSLGVEPGAQLNGIDFSLKSMKPLRVTGSVVNYGDGQPFAGEDVQLKRRLWDGMVIPGPEETRRTDAQGNFEFDTVLPGDYVVSVVTSLPGFRTLSDKLSLTVADSPVSGLRLAPKPYPSISGQLILENNNLPETKRVSLRFTNTDIELRRDEYDAGVDSDGTFQLSNVVPGTYRISLSGFSEDSFIRSATNGNQDALGYGLDVREGSAEDVRIIVGLNGGVVEGVVYKDMEHPAVGAAIVLLPDERDRVGLFRTATSDQVGHFTIHGVLPGPYRILAFTDLEPNIYFDPLFTQKYESQSTTVKIDEGGHVTLNLTAIRTPSLGGRQ